MPFTSYANLQTFHRVRSLMCRLWQQLNFLLFVCDYKCAWYNKVWLVNDHYHVSDYRHLMMNGKNPQYGFSCLCFFFFFCKMIKFSSNIHINIFQGAPPRTTFALFLWTVFTCLRETQKLTGKQKHTQIHSFHSQTTIIITKKSWKTNGLHQNTTEWANSLFKKQRRCHYVLPIVFAKSTTKQTIFTQQEM